ncbi:FMN-binding negative transcriptional regulator [Arenibacter sp. 6A1]|uniref:FMN-binding negative transcriptional regulator n=1 Tax=Arenibacter sp. 6A1 TaxID=2720391 RepID=UPI001444FC88|nr:FMN-binding negative transcriptional regulator [Arenibacter sp. 6A1]NKI27193.1 FMN-binding negative transcriptional regulator [Arenibacter sp. 6A1]
MYTPSHYKNTNLAEVKEFLKQNSFGILVNQLEGRPWATHIPLELSVDKDGNDILVGHVSKANPQWKSFKDQGEVLAIFNGPHSYISSSWYQDEEVPTWNYVAVHVYGIVKILSEAEVLASLHQLVEKHEKVAKNPISLHHMSAETMNQVQGIVGFQIAITEIQATYKLSQTRSQDHANIIDELQHQEHSGAREIAEMMKNNTKK